MCCRRYKILCLDPRGATKNQHFLLKTQERIIDVHNWSSLTAVDLNMLTKAEFHSLVGHIEKTLHYKEYIMVASLDMGGAKPSNPKLIIAAMGQLDIKRVVLLNVG